MTREEFFDAKLNAALWDVAVSIKRGNPLPLDSNSVFASYAELAAYAAGPLAYPGQIIAVVEETQTKIYYLDQNLNIQSFSSGGGSFDPEGTIELYGGSATDNITLTDIKEDETNG